MALWFGVESLRNRDLIDSNRKVAHERAQIVIESKEVLRFGRNSLAIFQLWISWRWCWWEAHDSWQISKTADEVVYGAAIASVPLYYISTWKPRARKTRKSIQIIHENGNRQQKEHRLLFCWKEAVLLITFVEAFSKKPRNRPETRRLVKFLSYGTEPVAAHLHFSVLSLLSRWFRVRLHGRDILLSD